MVVTAAKYRAYQGTTDLVDATIDGESLQVPLDPANRHYAAILEWVDAGNTIAAAD